MSLFCVCKQEPCRLLDFFSTTTETHKGNVICTFFSSLWLVWYKQVLTRYTCTQSYRYIAWNKWNYLLQQHVVWIRITGRCCRCIFFLSRCIHTKAVLLQEMMIERKRIYKIKAITSGSFTRTLVMSCQRYILAMVFSISITWDPCLLNRPTCVSMCN